MKKYGPEKLNNILANVTKNLGIDRGMKEISFFNMWPDIVGERFSKNTKAVSVKKGRHSDTLIVAVSSSLVASDLYFFKSDILNKIQKVSFSLGLNIKDIVFNHKIWMEFRAIPESEEYKTCIKTYDDTPTVEELDNIELPENIVNDVKNSVDTQYLEQNEIKDRMFNLIINDIKLQVWRKNKGFPSCEKCGITLVYVNQNEETLCPSCKCND